MSRALRLMFTGLWQHKATEIIEDVLREHFDYDLEPDERQALAEGLAMALSSPPLKYRDLIICPDCAERRRLADHWKRDGACPACGSEETAPGVCPWCDGDGETT